MVGNERSNVIYVGEAHRLRCVIAAVLLVPVVVLAGEVPVYKTASPRGSVSYADAPPVDQRNTSILLVEPHAADPEAAKVAQSALLDARRRQQQEAAARDEKLRQLNQEMLVAVRRLQQAQIEVEKGREIGAGDRQGRRLTPEYWQRQRLLEMEMTRAREDMARLRSQGAALN